MEIKGKLIKKEDVKTFKGDKGELRVMDFVVETNEKFPQKVALQCKGDTVDEIHNMNIGDENTFNINIKGREYNGKYYNTLECWSISKSKGTKASASATSAPAPEKPKSELPW